MSLPRLALLLAPLALFAAPAGAWVDTLPPSATPTPSRGSDPATLVKRLIERGGMERAPEGPRLEALALDILRTVPTPVPDREEAATDD